MAQHKQSTFERLRNGKLRWNRKERREVEGRLNSTDPGLEIVNPHAAGIDVGDESHDVAVPPGRDAQAGREFRILDGGPGRDGAVVEKLGCENRRDAIHWGVWDRRA